MRWALLLGVGLAVAARADEPRLWATEFSIGGNLTQFERNHSELWQGRLLALRIVYRGLTFDSRAQFTSVFPVDPAPLRGSAEVRLGYTGRRFAIVAGAYLLDGFNTTPRFQLFPSARVEVSLGEFSVLLGLWDFHLPSAPVRLSVQNRDYGIGYVFPFGVEAHVRLRLLEFIGVDVAAMVVQRPGGEVVVFGSLMAALGVRSGKTPGPRSLIPPFLNPAL